MKNKKVRNSIFTFSTLVTLVTLTVVGFTQCHQDIIKNVEILYYYNESTPPNSEYDNGLEKALQTAENKLVITKTKEKIINPGAETKYIIGQFKDQAATMIYREDVAYINSFYSAHDELAFSQIKHLHPNHTRYAAALLDQVKTEKAATVFITDQSAAGEVYSDVYEEETFQTKILLEEGKVNFSSEVDYLLSLATENIILAVSNANFTRFVYDLSVSSFAGNLYIADSYLQTDLSLPPAFLSRAFMLKYVSAFNFNDDISGAPSKEAIHDLRAFYQGFAAGKLILALEKAKSMLFVDTVFIDEVDLNTGPTVLANFIYDAD